MPFSNRPAQRSASEGSQSGASENSQSSASDVPFSDPPRRFDLRSYEDSFKRNVPITKATAATISKKKDLEDRATLKWKAKRSTNYAPLGRTKSSFLRKLNSPSHHLQALRGLAVGGPSGGDVWLVDSSSKPLTCPRPWNQRQLLVVKIKRGCSDFIDENTFGDLEMFELLNLGRCHCNIAELLGWTKTFYGTNWNLLYFEYCNAGDIGRFLWESNRRETLIPEAFVWHVFSELTQAIDFLHNPPEEEERYPLMHLDIKPEKVFLTWTSDDHNHYPRVKLGDFGIAMSVPKDKGLKLTSNRGSWAYMSPEASAITSRVFPKSDVWGVGTVIHCMVHSSDTPPRSQENSCDPDAYGFDEDCSSPVNMIGNEYSPIDIEQIDPMERPFKNSYAEMYGKECPAHYSQALNDLMMKTLAVDRLKRIDTSSLLDVVVASEKDRRDLLFRPLPDWYQKMHYESMQRLDPVPIDIGNLEIPIVIDDDEPGPLESAKELYSKKKTEEIIIIKSQPEGPQAPNIHAPKRDVPESHTPKPTRITALQNKKTRKAREPKQSKKADPKKKPRKAREPQQAKKAIQKKTKKKR